MKAERQRERLEDAMSLASKMEKGAVRQGIQVALTLEKSGSRLPPRASGRN